MHSKTPRGFTNEFIIFKLEIIFKRKNLQLTECLALVSVGRNPNLCDVYTPINCVGKIVDGWKSMTTASDLIREDLWIRINVSSWHFEIYKNTAQTYRLFELLKGACSFHTSPEASLINYYYYIVPKRLRDAEIIAVLSCTYTAIVLSGSYSAYAGKCLFGFFFRLHSMIVRKA